MTTDNNNSSQRQNGKAKTNFVAVDMPWVVEIRLETKPGEETIVYEKYPLRHVLAKFSKYATKHVVVKTGKTALYGIPPMAILTIPFEASIRKPALEEVLEWLREEGPTTSTKYQGKIQYAIKPAQDTLEKMVFIYQTMLFLDFGAPFDDQKVLRQRLADEIAKVPVLTKSGIVGIYNALHKYEGIVVAKALTKFTNQVDAEVSKGVKHGDSVTQEFEAIDPGLSAKIDSLRKEIAEKREAGEKAGEKARETALARLNAQKENPNLWANVAKKAAQRVLKDETRKNKPTLALSRTASVKDKPAAAVSAFPPHPRDSSMSTLQTLPETKPDIAPVANIAFSSSNTGPTVPPTWVKPKPDTELVAKLAAPTWVKPKPGITPVTSAASISSHTLPSTAIKDKSLQRKRLVQLPKSKTFGALPTVTKEAATTAKPTPVVSNPWLNSAALGDWADEVESNLASQNPS
jgi:hypothetical protein